LIPLLGILVLVFLFKGLIIFSILVIACVLFASIDAYLNAKKLGFDFTPKSYNRWYIYLVSYLASAIIIIPLFLFLIPFKTWSLGSNSMCPTLMKGDRLAASKFYYMIHKPQRGDIVTFPNPSNPHQIWLKRIIGLPGDNVEMQGKQVFINGRLIDEPYLVSNEQCPSVSQEVSVQKYGSTSIPGGQLFVLGDNRDNSYDSRSFGFIDIKTLKGKALFLYWAKNKSRIGSEVK
jgi:signal peptidase I